MRKCQTLEEVFEFINYWDVERKNLARLPQMGLF